jgi:phosphatidylserine decarboxylase
MMKARSIKTRFKVTGHQSKVKSIASIKTLSFFQMGYTSSVMVMALTANKFPSLFQL